MTTVNFKLRTVIIAALIAALVIAGGTAIAVHVVSKSHQQIAATQARENQYKAQVSADQKTITDNGSKIATLEKQGATVQTRIVTREKVVTVAMNKVLDPTLSAQQVADSAKKNLTLKHPELIAVSGDMISLHKDDVALQIATKIEDNGLKQDKIDFQKLLDDAKQENEMLKSNLTFAQRDREAADDMSSQWKNVAGATTKAKIVRDLKFGAALVGTAAVSYEVGKHL